MIREMQKSDRNEILEMMEIFYSSPAVLSNGSAEIFENDFENCVNSSPFLEGYVFTENGKICGYAMAAKSFSTEFGKPCIWIEDLFIKPEFRGCGFGGEFLKFIDKKYKGCVLRLEVEEENSNAVSVYKKRGFEVLPYMEMIKKN